MSFKPIVQGWKRFVSSRRVSPWGGIAASVVGTKHLAHSRSNQDAAQTATRPGGSVIAVADGHSMAACCRADRGSRIAVEVMVETALAWIESLDRNAKPSIEAAIDLSESTNGKWRRRVRADIGLNSFTPEEISALGSAISTPTVAYGTTLVASVATDKFCLGLQIGDGQLFAVTDAGVAGQLIVPAESIGEESDSLCAADALTKYRFAFVSFNDVRPAAIICSTDGYDKAFRSTDDFLRIGSLFVESLRAAGPDELAAALPAALREASDEGSRDDVSCAILFRKDLYCHGRTC